MIRSLTCSGTVVTVLVLSLTVVSTGCGGPEIPLPEENLGAAIETVALHVEGMT